MIEDTQADQIVALARQVGVVRAVDLAKIGASRTMLAYEMCHNTAARLFAKDSSWKAQRFDDPGASGESIERPARSALLEIATRDAVACVLVYRGA